ncbi:hypothetical protein GCAAIG_01505 [Candidatus Electronema halotolerans]
MNQLGFFDFYIRLSRIDKAGDPLGNLEKFEIKFFQLINSVFDS